MMGLWPADLWSALRNIGRNRENSGPYFPQGVWLNGGRDCQQDGTFNQDDGLLNGVKGYSTEEESLLNRKNDPYCCCGGTTEGFDAGAFLKFSSR